MTKNSGKRTANTSKKKNKGKAKKKVAAVLNDANGTHNDKGNHISISRFLSVLDSEISENEGVSKSVIDAKLSTMLHVKEQEEDENESSSCRIFRNKLSGAIAILFSEACMKYVDTVEEERNSGDRTWNLPSFSGLSPQQRLHLVKEVSIGLLCEGEPLPQREEHVVAYSAIVETIHSAIEGEIDDAQHDFGDEYPVVKKIHNSNPRRDKYGCSQRITGDMHKSDDERRKKVLLSKIASRRVEKMSNQNLKENDPCGKRKSTRCDQTHSTNERIKTLIKYRLNWVTAIFEGGAVSDEWRLRLKPNCKDDHHWLFNWRMLCDDALQEDDSHMLPLKNVNFCWKSCNSSKWRFAINELMFKGGLNTKNRKVHDVIQLHQGRIRDEEFTSSLKFLRVKQIFKIVQSWRKQYEENWSPSLIRLDQRCIFSICSKERNSFLRKEMKWVRRFFKECKQKDIKYFNGGEYQKRLEIFRSMEHYKLDSLEEYLSCHPWNLLKHPSDYNGLDFSSISLHVGNNYNNCKSGYKCILNYKEEHKLKPCSGWYVNILLRFYFY